MVHRNDKLVWGLFCLRFGLGLFIILWGIDKLIDPANAIAIFRSYYIVNIDWVTTMLVGTAEVVLGAFITLGLYKRYSYALGLLVHATATLARYGILLAPFGKNDAIIASVPILFAFIALFLCRDFDTKLTLQKKKSIFFHRK